MPALKHGQYLGVDLPEGVNRVGPREMMALMEQPGAKEAFAILQRADQFENGEHVGRHLAFEVKRNSPIGRFTEEDLQYAQKVIDEKRRLQNA